MKLQSETSAINMWTFLLCLCGCVAVAVASEAATKHCPTNCTCTPTDSAIMLTVDCQGRPDHDEQLSEQINSLLSSNTTHGRLTKLTIANTPLTRVPRSVCRLTMLTHLTLHHNRRLTRLPDNCLTNLSNMVEFHAYENAIETLQDGVFDRLGKLELLKLSGNLINSIGLSVFSTSSNLPKLTAINLSRNNLTSLEPWVYDRGLIGTSSKKIQIDLRRNKISNFTNKMGRNISGHNGRCFDKGAHADVDLRENYVEHFADIWSGWQLDIKEVLWCYRRDKGRINLRIMIGGNATACDCINYPFFIIEAMRKWIPPAICSSFDPLTNKSVIEDGLNLDPSQFVCEISDRCPARCVCVHRPANATLHVYCSNKDIRDLPTELPVLPDNRTKYKLDFSNNKRLRRLEQRNYFVNTAILDVSSCGVDSIDDRAWEEMSTICDIIDLSGNKLTSLPASFQSINVTAKVNLSNNPWECSCGNKWMSQWFRSLGARLADNRIQCQSPYRLRHYNILKIEQKFCKDPDEAVKKSVLISLSTVGALVVLLLSASVITYRLRVAVYIKWKFHPFNRDECAGEDMDYDVFLCCHSEDEESYGRDIRELIQSKDYRVFYPEFDVQGGRNEIGSMGEAIEHSKRTVCLISENFLRW